MRIKEVQPSCGLLVELMPDDCHALADACHEAAGARMELSKGADANGRAAQLYGTLACLFEGLGLAGAAPGFLIGEDRRRYSVAGVRAVWGAAEQAS